MRVRSDVVRVASIESTGERETVYNFEVEGTHTYLVGETGVLVHNAYCGEIVRRFGSLNEARNTQFGKTR